VSFPNFGLRLDFNIRALVLDVDDSAGPWSDKLTEFVLSKIGGYVNHPLDAQTRDVALATIGYELQDLHRAGVLWRNCEGRWDLDWRGWPR
jgi:hypothetical protein